MKIAGINSTIVAETFPDPMDLTISMSIRW